MTQDRHEENKLIAERRKKLAAIRARVERGGKGHGHANNTAFPNDFRRDSMAADLARDYAGHDKDALAKAAKTVSIAGRMMSRRVMGKAAFVHLQDGSGKIQLYVQRDALGAGFYDHEFKHWDIGDIVGGKGELFRTNKGELSVRVSELRLLAKSLRPLPEKFHGLTDTEARYRQRYLDLIMNPAAREVFARRSAVINFAREYFNAAGFLEVETPMLHAIPGGAAARPFETHHNALDTQLYLRIAPELYLKRLLVGGMESVYEINRSFRNEGLSTRHNPEFTMLEFYQAYADYQGFMDLTEDFLRATARATLGGTTVTYQGETYDFAAPFARFTVKEAIARHTDISEQQLQSPAEARKAATRLGIAVNANDSLGKTQLDIFESTVERSLRHPTFITAYPTEASPLARRNDADPTITDRFELFIAGREIANGFSELNDAEDQAARFRHQAEQKATGDHQAMHYDADYITALEYGMPPSAGAGIGIDRLVMLLTDSPSIRDVLLFPQLRPGQSSAG